MDRIFIEKLLLKGRHGVLDHERLVEQEFLVDISVEFDTHNAAKSDKIKDTIDYVRFYEIARDVMGGAPFFLIERLAETIAQKILEDARIEQVSISVRKPLALEAGVPGVTVIRART
jgi:dihydroneopterin aldolase